MIQDSDSPLKQLIDQLTEQEEEKEDVKIGRSKSCDMAGLLLRKKDSTTKEIEKNINNSNQYHSAIFISHPRTSSNPQPHFVLPQEESIYNSIGRNDPLEVRIKKKQAFSKLLEMEFQELMIKRCLDEIPNIQRLSYQEILELAVVELCNQVPEEEFKEPHNEVTFMQIEQKIARSFSQILKGAGSIGQQVQQRHHSLHEPTNMNNFPNFSFSIHARNGEQQQYISKECPICLEKFNFDIESYQQSPLLTCSHNFCPDCLKSYITAKINCADVLSITCPQEDCNAVFADKSIHLILQDDYQYERYVKFKSKQQLLKDPDVRQCITPDCNATIKGTPNNPKLICNDCGQAMCYFCTNPWHEGISCEEAIDAEYNTIASKFLVKLCPQCSSRISKNEGCNHMTCTQCDYEFCWLCMKTYTSNHYGTNNIRGCPGLQFAQSIPRFFWLLFYLKIIGLGFLYVLGGIVALCLLPLGILIFAVAIPIVIYIEIRNEITFYYNDCNEIIKIAVFLVIGVLTAPLNLLIALLYLIVFLWKEKFE